MQSLRNLSLILLLFITAVSYSQLIEHEKLLSFEEVILPDYISGSSSSVTYSTLHYKDGKQSLEWSFEPKGELIIKKTPDLKRKIQPGKILIFPHLLYGYIMRNLMTLPSLSNF